MSNQLATLHYTMVMPRRIITENVLMWLTWYVTLQTFMNQYRYLGNISHRIHVWYIYIYIYANIGGILVVDVTIYSIYGSYGYKKREEKATLETPAFVDHWIHREAIGLSISIVLLDGMETCCEVVWKVLKILKSLMQTDGFVFKKKIDDLPPGKLTSDIYR